MPEGPQNRFSQGPEALEDPPNDSSGAASRVDTHVSGWRNRGGGSDWGSNLRDGLTAVPTDSQVLPHESFLPEYVSLRYEEHFESEAPPNLILATPPAWTETPGMLCVPIGKLQTRAEVEAWHDRWDVRGPKEAEQACAGCPALAECREAALEEEGGRPASHRFLVRGGLTPGGRWRLEQGDSPWGHGPNGLVT